LSRQEKVNGETIIAAKRAPITEMALPGPRYADDRYDDEMSQKQNVAHFYALGREVEHLCRVCDIGVSTFYRWKKDDEEFIEAYEKARSRTLERAYNRARFRATELIESDDENIALRASLGVMQHVVTLNRERSTLTDTPAVPGIVVLGDVLQLGSKEAASVLARGQAQLSDLEEGKRVKTVDVLSPGAFDTDSSDE
jgi:hypothetical protein